MPAALLLPQLSAGTEVVDELNPLQYEQSSQECAWDSGKLSATRERESCSVEAETNSFRRDLGVFILHSEIDPDI